MTTRIEYKGELIAAGEMQHTPWMFWNAIKVDESFDIEAVIARCREIYETDRIRFERVNRTMLFAPAYEAKRDETLT